MLLDFGIIPYLVFDGASLPSKADTNEDRRRRRKDAKAAGMDLYKSGKIPQAYKEFQTAVEITFHMTRRVIEELRSMNVRYVVAPYEADAQLVYLERINIIDAILSEDSDMLVFGAKRLLSKLDQYGACIEISRDDFGSCREISLVGWTDAMFRRMAILSGCDYLKNIPKLGLRNAYRYIRTYKDLDRMFRMIQFEGQFTVPTDYPQQFKNAEMTFLYQRVFCPLKQKLVFLEDLPPGTTTRDVLFLGDDIDQDTAVGIACGDLHPSSKTPVEPPAAPLRSLAGHQTRQSLTTPHALKPSKSIDSFFRLKREPLGELDPNILTPSPSQRQLLQTYSDASWEMRTVSSATQLRRTGTSISISSRALEPSIFDSRASFLARAATRSHYKPPKRQRLCSEQEEASPSKEVKQSLFFTQEVSNSLAQPRKGRSRKARKSDFDVWSDDSVSDEALLALADIQQPASSVHLQCEYAAVDPIDDGVGIIPQSSPVRCGESPNHASNETRGAHPDDTSQPHVSRLEFVPPTDTATEPEDFEDILEIHTAQQTTSLLKTFVYQSPTRRTTALASLSPTDRRPQGRDSTAADQDPNLPAFTIRSTPVKGIQLETPKTFAGQSPSQQAYALQSLTSPQATVVKVHIGKSTLESNMHTSRSITEAEALVQFGQQALEGTLKRGDSVHNIDAEELLNPLLKGSEDHLVPDTEDEGSSVGDSPLRRQLDLQAFPFTKA